MEEAGAFSVVLEYVATETAGVITETLSIPTIGVRAGLHCDGQVHDVFGVYEKAPPFTRKYADLRGVMLDALKGYEADVTAEGFPGAGQTSRMDPWEKERFEKQLDLAYHRD